jgi:hypothetical protein
MVIGQALHRSTSSRSSDHYVHTTSRSLVLSLPLPTSHTLSPESTFLLVPKKYARQPANRTISLSPRRLVTVHAETRVCSKCKESKPFPSSFHRAGLNRSGIITYRPDCADCHRALDRVAKRLKRAMQKAPAQSVPPPKQPKVVSLTQHLDSLSDDH